MNTHGKIGRAVRIAGAFVILVSLGSSVGVYFLVRAIQSSAGSVASSPELQQVERPDDVLPLDADPHLTPHRAAALPLRSQGRVRRHLDMSRASLLAHSHASGRFPDTPVGRALEEHLLISTDVTAGADARKAQSIAELRKNAEEASEDLIGAYREAPKQQYFGRWLLSLTLAELNSPEAYAALREIATSEIQLESADPEKRELMNESVIRQSAVLGLALLAKSGNTAADEDMLNLALNPPSGEDAVRTMAIKGYLGAGSDYDARVQTLLAQLPEQYQALVTLTVSKPEAPHVPIQQGPAQPAAPHELPPPPT